MLLRIWIAVLCFLSYATAHEPAPGSGPFKLFSGSANTELTAAVADLLNIPVGKATIGKFNDGEIRIKLLDNIRNCDVFILQSICISPQSTVNDNLMELFLMVRTMKRTSAKSVTAVIPYYGYARQDRKNASGVPISASDVAMMLELAGADHVMAMDLHCGQIQGFFHGIPVDNLPASKVFIPYITKQNLQNPVVVSPDAGGVERAKIFIEGLQAQGMDTRLAVIVKQRADAGVVESMNLVGKVENCDVVIIDDICDTAGTLVQAAAELKKQGAKRVFACVTHPLFSGPAIERIAFSTIDKLLVADTIPLRSTMPPNVEQLTIAPLLAEAIQRTAQGKSLHELFTN
jgi:ribose-phosphate pyrophosphokinase